MVNKHKWLVATISDSRDLEKHNLGLKFVSAKYQHVTLGKIIIFLHLSFLM